MLSHGFDWTSVQFAPRRVADFADLRYGRALQAALRRPGSIAVYGTNGPCGSHDTPLVDGPGVILGRKGQGHLGVEWSPKPFWVIDTAYFAELDERVVDAKWFYYVTRYVGLDHLKTGEKPGLQRDTFRAQAFPYPPVRTQRAISSILSLLDDKIDLNRRMNRTLEEIASALFRSWFVEFDPVVAKAAGRAPFGMDTATAALFPSGFEDLDFGPIPRGWQWKRLAEVVDLNPRRELRSGSAATYVDMSCLPTRGHTPESWEVRAAGSGTRFRNGDTLLARITPCLENGKTAFVDFLELNEVAWGSTEYIVTAPRPPLPAVYGYLIARDPTFRDDAAQGMTGSSGRQRVSAEHVGRYVVAIAPPAVMEKFGSSVTSFFDLARANATESRTLAAVRDTLLPKLLSGEIRLRDAERTVEAAL